MDNAANTIQQTLEVLRSFNLSDTYQVMPTKGFTDRQLLDYWESLDRAGLVRYRLNDVSDPSAYDGMMYQRMSEQAWNKTICMVVVETSTSKIVAEVAVTDVTGKAGQFHFSVLDTNPPQLNKYLGKAVTSLVLDHLKNTHGEPYLDTLYGLTPVKNRTACFLVLQSGFKKLGILPSGCTYNNEISDAMVTVKVRTE